MWGGGGGVLNKQKQDFTYKFDPMPIGLIQG